ncbi:MAG: hypothetical protein NC131_08390 [Roseburia sp.]|nr:hypothetical protein [Roseburia sp.]
MHTEKKELSILTQVNLQYIFTGSCFAISGIVGFFDTLPTLIINVVTALLAVCCLAHVMVARKEMDDEMSKEHLQRAQATVLTWSQMILALGFAVPLILRFADVQAQIGKTVTLCNMFLLILGMQHIATGLLFRRYEKEGY